MIVEFVILILSIDTFKPLIHVGLFTLVTNVTHQLLFGTHVNE